MDSERCASKKEKLLVSVFVLLTIWDFTLGFTALTGGGIGTVVINFRLRLLLEIFCCCLLLFLSANHKKYFNTTRTNVNMVIVFSVAYVFYISKQLFELNFFGIIFSPIQFLVVYYFLRLRDELKIVILDNFIQIISIILVLSIIEYLIFFLTGQKYVLFSSLYYFDRPYEQTLFNLMPSVGVQLLENNMYRFQSIAEEPGAVGTLCSFLLFATYGSERYRFHYIVFWIAGILSFSLAFYILSVFHLISVIVFYRKYSIIVILAIVLTVLLYYFRDAFDLLILDRVFGKSVEEIDNRTAEYFQRAYDRAWKDGTIWFGYGIDTSAIDIDGGSAGLKKMIFQYGVFRTIAIVFAFVYCYFKSMPQMSQRSKLMTVSFCICFLINIYQRHYILLFTYVLPFFVMPLFLSYKEKNT